MESVAKELARGRTPEQMVQKVHLTLPTIERYISHPEFERVFKNLDAPAYKAWKATKDQAMARRAVQAQAREDAPGFYQKLKQIVESGELDDKDRATFLVKLLQMSGVVGEEIVHETMAASAVHLDAIEKALTETRRGGARSKTS